MGRQQGITTEGARGIGRTKEIDVAEGESDAELVLGEVDSTDAALDELLNKEVQNALRVISAQMRSRKATVKDKISAANRILDVYEKRASARLEAEGGKGDGKSLGSTGGKKVRRLSLVNEDDVAAANEKLTPEEKLSDTS